MSRVLVVGWGLPQAASDGAAIFLQRLAGRYRQNGDHVEVFTIARPDKWNSSEDYREWQIYRKEFEGITYHVLIRPWGVLYTDPADPLQTVHEQNTKKIWLDFMASSGGWDIVHFNAINPLEIIECTKKLGCLVRFSFHNYYLLFPIEHLFSYIKFRDNPNSDLTIYDPTGEAAVAEYEAMGALPGMTESRKKELARKFQSRMDYGKYLLDDVIDEVWGSHLRFLATSRALFGAGFRNARLFEPLAKHEDRGHLGAETAARFESSDKIIIAELANIHCYKGQHILVALCDHLRDFAGKFEIRFYGGVNDPEYMKSLSLAVERDRFKKEHIRFCGSYLPPDLDRIASEVHVHVSCIPLTPYISGTILETYPRGVLPVYKEDVLFAPLKQRMDCTDMMSYETGNLEELAQLIRNILSGHVDVAGAYSRTARIIETVESLGMESLNWFSPGADQDPGKLQGVSC